MHGDKIGYPSSKLETGDRETGITSKYLEITSSYFGYNKYYNLFEEYLFGVWTDSPETRQISR